MSSKRVEGRERREKGGRGGRPRLSERRKVRFTVMLLHGFVANVGGCYMHIHCKLFELCVMNIIFEKRMVLSGNIANQNSYFSKKKWIQQQKAKKWRRNTNTHRTKIIFNLSTSTGGLIGLLCEKEQHQQLKKNEIADKWIKWERERWWERESQCWIFTCYWTLSQRNQEGAEVQNCTTGGCISSWDSDNPTEICA